MFIYLQSPDTAAWQNDYLQGEFNIENFASIHGKTSGFECSFDKHLMFFF